MESGVVSHRSAAALYRLGDLPADVHEFTLPARRQTRRVDVRPHRARLGSRSRVAMPWVFSSGCSKWRASMSPRSGHVARVRAWRLLIPRLPGERGHERPVRVAGGVSARAH